MSDKRRSIPLIAGVSILFLIPIGVGAFAVSYLGGEEEGATETDGTAIKEPETDSFGFYSEESAAPMPSFDSERGGANPVEDGGIPIGKYSNPPTEVESGRKTYYGNYQGPLNDSGSSINRNKSIQRTLGGSASGASSSSSSSSIYRDSGNNELADPLEDESLVDSLEDDSFLEVPDSERESIPLAPVSEPLSQPDIAR